MRAVWCGAIVCMLVLLAASGARANGRFPAANQLLFSPTDPRFVLLRTTFGVLLSHDGGTTWSWLCEDALGLSASQSEDPSLGLTAGGALVAGIYNGLEVSPDTGCTWGFAGAGLRGQRIVDIAVRPDSPHAVTALASTYDADAGADAGTSYVSQVYESTDDGASWSPLGVELDPTVLATTLDVAASDPARIYIVGFRLAMPGTPWLFSSTDRGAHFTALPMPALSREVGVYIAAVDPTNADIVYLRSQGTPINGQSRLFVTFDAGQTYEVALALSGQMLGFALSSDGSKLYAGSAQDGLFVAARANLASMNPFQKVSSIHVQCLATHGPDLWACSDEPSGFVAGSSNDDGAMFTARFHLNAIAAPIACAPGMAAAQCSGSPFQQLCNMLGGCAELDGGADGQDAGSTPPASRRGSGCGCSSAGTASAAGLFAALGFGALVARRKYVLL